MSQNGSNYNSLKLMVIWILIHFTQITHSHSIKIDVNNGNYTTLPRFYTGTGFSPPGNVTEFLKSEDLHQNLILISSNQGLEYVRTHWIFDTVRKLDFSNLDLYFDKHIKLKLIPSIEFMGNISLESWGRVSELFLKRYIKRYGLSEIEKWRFETWNEPDLLSYNRLNWNLSDFIQYLNLIKDSFRLIEREYPTLSMTLRGPAGLFKSKERHTLCYGILDYCEENRSSCPIDLLTFHRKGQGTAQEIIDGESSLLFNLTETYSFLKNVKWSNTEADPTSGWSKPLELNQGIEYAVELILNVMLHWNFNRTEAGYNLDSISHDNAFLSYHPFEFSQRTLFARFQMNETVPKYSEFVVKPVYTSLSMLGLLGSRADKVVETKSKHWIWTTKSNKGFYSILIVGKEKRLDAVRVKIRGLGKGHIFGILIEVLESGVDPFTVWEKNKLPPYPNQTLFDEMRKVQSPKLIKTGQIKENMTFVGHFNSPFVMQIRICPNKIRYQIETLNIRKITRSSVLIYWSIKSKADQINCIREFKVFFKERNSKWREISKGFRLTFNFFQFNPSNSSIYGVYKLKAMDIYNPRKSLASKVVHFKRN